ncbi:MAG: hypothetical protein LBV27_07410 [Oscillospiraceae bacterium]|nr:hypothetical protein [Oscillospiraceae bacterium]
MKRINFPAAKTSFPAVPSFGAKWTINSCRCVAVFLSALLLFCGCARRGADTGLSSIQAGGRAASGVSELPSRPETDRDGEQPAASQSGGNAENTQSYIEQVAQEVAAGIAEPGMSEYERAKAAFDYMIASTNLVKPIGLDLWRIRSADGAPQPSYVENRALSVLLYGVGMCEDYAAGFTMLLRGMGLEAEYVPGLTYSTEGALVDHAWVVAKIDGTWYHLDCQLEDNISRHGAIRYRYFMKSDQTLAGSHRWGQNLIDSRLLTPEQNEEIARHYLMPECPRDYETPPRQVFDSVPVPDLEKIQYDIDREFLEYEKINGPLASLTLNIIPPVFGLDGYGPAD